MDRPVSTLAQQSQEDRGRTSAGARGGSRPRRARWLIRARWLLGALTWAPFLAWVTWLVLDRRLDLHPWTAGVGVLVLIATWVCAGRHSAGGRVWPMLAAATVVFAVSYSVAARSAAIGGFIVISTLGCALSNSVRGALLSAWAEDLTYVPSYGAIEESVLRNVMLSETAMMPAIAAGRTGKALSSTVVAVAIGLLVGGILSWFVFALVYAVMNVALSLTQKGEVA